MMPYLEELALNMQDFNDWDFSVSMTWKYLRILKLGGLMIYHVIFLPFLDRHKDTLKELTLHSCYYYGPSMNQLFRDARNSLELDLCLYFGMIAWSGRDPSRPFNEERTFFFDHSTDEEFGIEDRGNGYTTALNAFMTRKSDSMPELDDAAHS